MEWNLEKNDVFLCKLELLKTKILDSSQYEKCCFVSISLFERYFLWYLFYFRIFYMHGMYYESEFFSNVMLQWWMEQLSKQSKNENFTLCIQNFFMKTNNVIVSKKRCQSIKKGWTLLAEQWHSLTKVLQQMHTQFSCPFIWKNLLPF